MSKVFAATATLIGTVIGAGILGIPYVIMRAGFFVGLLSILVVLAIVILIELYISEVGLRTRSTHQLPGYAEIYLGKKGKLIMLLVFGFSIYSGLVAYIIGESQSISQLIFGSTAYAFQIGLIFWLVMSFLSYFGLKALRDGEEIGVMFIFVMIVAIAVLFWNKVDVVNLTYNNYALFYVPFGVIFFAFMGFSTMPEIEKMLQMEKHKAKKVIISAYIIVAIIYIAFAIFVVGSQGTQTPEVATLALGKPFVFLGIFTMFTSYLALNTALIDTLQFDYKKKKVSAWIYSAIVPILIYLILHYFNADSFINVLGVGGVISGGLMVTMILLMVYKAKKKGNRAPEYSIPFSKIIAGLIILLLAAAIVLQLIHV